MISLLKSLDGAVCGTTTCYPPQSHLTDACTSQPGWRVTDSLIVPDYFTDVSTTKMSNKTFLFFFLFKILPFQTKHPLGNGCGSVGRAVAADTKGPWFQTSPRQLLVNHFFPITVVEKTKIKEKRPGMGYYYKKQSILWKLSIFVQFFARCVKVGPSKMTYDDAKAYCKTQTHTYQGVTISAQLFDLRSSSFYTSTVKGWEMCNLKTSLFLHT